MEGDSAYLATICIVVINYADRCITWIDLDGNVISEKQLSGSIAELMPSSIKDDLKSIFELSEPHKIAAIAIITSSPLGQSVIYQPESQHRIPIIQIPIWAVELQSMPQLPERPLLIDLEGTGKVMGFYRQSQGGYVPLNPSVIPLTDLIFTRSPSPIDQVCDRIQTISIKPDESVPPSNSTFAQEGNSLSAAIEALSPLVKLFSESHQFVAFDKIVIRRASCDKAFAVLLHHAFSIAGIELPVIQVFDASLSPATGAYRIVRSTLEKTRVWRIENQGGTDLYINVERVIRYRIVHTTRPAFDPQEDAIRSFVKSSPFVAVIDRNVDRLYGQQIRTYLSDLNVLGILVIDATEQHKTIQQVERIAQACLEFALPRDGMLVGIGGGITLDIVGFAASMVRRGISYLRVPTTLVGLIDVSIGIKQGVNFHHQKNVLGAFYPAIGSVNDRHFLRTLSKQDLRCGIAEIIKMALVADAELFFLLEEFSSELIVSHFSQPSEVVQDILSRAEYSMLTELSYNLFEEDLRRLVDFGHSFSPMIETMSEYQIPHGEAVALDMLISTLIAQMRGICSVDLGKRLIALYRAIGLSLVQEVCSAEQLLEGLHHIKLHRGGNLNLVVPVAIGQATFIQNVSLAEIHRAIDTLNNQ